MEYLKFIVLSLLLAAALAGNAGQLKGYISDAEDATPLPGVMVTNKTRNVTVMSDADGQYLIAAAGGDDIQFSYLGYYPVTITMSGEEEAFRRISLRRKTISLDEVRIGPGYTPYQVDSINRQKTYGGVLNKERGSILNPASAIAQQLSARSRREQRFRRNFSRWESELFVGTRYTPEEVAALTGLKGDTLAAFMNAYPMPEDFARTATDMEMKMWIKYNYREWIKHPVIIPEGIKADDPVHYKKE